MSKEVKDFWNRRAKLGIKSGSKDIIARNLEMDNIMKLIKEGKKVIDIGCGDGALSYMIAKKGCNVLGIDFSSKMIAYAKEKYGNKNPRFLERDMTDMGFPNNVFDIAVTERCIINLDTKDAQIDAINSICDMLKPNGTYIMCENTKQGLDNLNSLREKFNLNRISQPWHNLYLDENMLSSVKKEFKLIKKVRFSSSYYVCSRIINARIAADSGKEPDYMSPINEIGAMLPSMGDYGQGKIFVFRKEARR